MVGAAGTETGRGRTGLPGRGPWGGRGQRLCRRRGLRASHSAPRSPQAYAAAAPGPGRLLKAGAAVLIAGALLLLAGAIGAFYFWKATERQVSTSSHRGGGGGQVELVACKEKHGLETVFAESIKKSLSRLFFFSPML